MNFQSILIELQNGKTVRRKSWWFNTVMVLDKDQFVISKKDFFSEFPETYNLSYHDITANDWEVIQ